MTHIAPIAREAIHDATVKALVERAETLGVPGSSFALVLARMPTYAKAVLEAMMRSHFEGAVDHELKEIIRILLARRAGSRYFTNLRSVPAVQAGLDEGAISAGCDDYERNPRFSTKQKLALRYADQMYLNPGSVDAAFYAELKQHYSEAEIMELGAFIALHYGMQVFMRTLETPAAPGESREQRHSM
jgi:alkylhydroperoxidase family enzyme